MADACSIGLSCALGCVAAHATSFTKQFLIGSALKKKPISGQRRKVSVSETPSRCLIYSPKLTQSFSHLLRSARTIQPENLPRETLEGSRSVKHRHKRLSDDRN